MDLTRSTIQHEKRLSSLPHLECEICSSDITDYYTCCAQMVSLSEQMLTAAVNHPQGHKILSSGRVVVLRDSVSASADRTRAHGD